MNRTRIAIVGLALLATACTSGGSTPGTPTPDTNTGSTSTSNSNVDGDNKLTSVKPCELISNSEASTLGITGSPTPNTSAGAETCEWIDKNGGLTVAVEPKQGSESFSYSETKTPATFGEYKGFTVAAPGKSADMCHAVISVTDSSSIQIIASLGSLSTDTAKACERATKSAELVAAKLT